jgi:signal peptidase
MRKWSGWVLGFFAWAAASIATFLLALSFVPTLFGFESLIVASGSMGRTLPIGSVALTRAVEAKAVSVGDVVTYRHRGESETVTHRVVALKDEVGRVAFTTKGDANADPDPQSVVVSGRIHRVEYVVPLAGHVIRYARTPLGGVALILVPIVGLMIDRRGRTSRSRRPGAGLRRRRSDAANVGWSTTTYQLVRGTPGLRSDPGG